MGVAFGSMSVGVPRFFSRRGRGPFRGTASVHRPRRRPIGTYAGAALDKGAGVV